MQRGWVTRQSPMIATTAKQSRLANRLREFFARAGLTTASILIGYAVLELIFFRFYLPQASLNLRPHVPDRADFFLQSSKKGQVPRDYIALVGDSYAQGLGDWVLANGGKSALPSHSGDVLHQLLGQDVVTVGRAAAGSAEGMVLRTTRIFDDAYCYLFPAIEAPARIVHYFYEGNDFDDNYRTLERRIRAAGNDLHGDIDRFLDARYASVSHWRCHGYLGETIFRMGRFLWRYRHYTSSSPLDAPTIQHVISGGGPIGAWQLDPPPMAIDDAQIDAAVAVYERSLAWLKRRFPSAPITVVYIPASAATYRHRDGEVITYGVYIPGGPGNENDLAQVHGLRFPIERIYARSRSGCEKIRAATLAQGVSFIDARPAMRKLAAERPVHGPRDWNHLNETGYRLLGGLVAARIAEAAADRCDDNWP